MLKHEKTLHPQNEVFERSSKHSSIRKTGKNNIRIKKETSITSSRNKLISEEDLHMRTFRSQKKIAGKELIAGIELGPQDDHLIFSQPVEINFEVEDKHNNKQAQVLVYHAGDQKFNKK